MTTDYKATLNLPGTDFPMRANLAQREPELLRQWDEIGVYRLCRNAKKGRPLFVLHDGPPYANGHIHMGTAFNKVLKDIVLKAKRLEGYDCPYVPGWDCHGLPIELQVDRELGAEKAGMKPGDFRRRCRAYAERFIDIQRDEFRRLGVFGDWQDPYLTMKHAYQAVIVREVSRFFQSGGIYRGFKPVYWCLSCRTALAEAEVEYQDRTSPSIFVSFPLAAGSGGAIAGEYQDGLSALIWTTTPWTIPANLAISAHPDFEYVPVKTDRGTFLMAAALVEEVARETGLAVLSTGPSLRGSELKGVVFRHPFIPRDAPIILGEHVTATSGTGLVHTAPGHGQEDYEIGHKHGLPVYSPLDDEGRFTDEVPQFQGQQVFDANAGVVELLEREGRLVSSGKVQHSYPHCWRCKSPVIFRATRQWFISMDANDLRGEALKAIKAVTWVPAWGEDRIYGMIENRPDWCISRQRLWGVPITVFTCSSCGEMLSGPEIFEHVAGIFEREGADVWFDREARDLMPPGTVCRACGSADFSKETDILDVWFDSGVSHAAVVEKREELSWPADMYLEGSDQHRGWFHSALLTSVGTRKQAPYRTVLTHGFVVDAEGKKMSKSAGNVIAPQEVIEKYGAEILRMWVAGEDYTSDIRISEEILQRLVEAYRRVRNTARFILGNLRGFDPDRDMVAPESMEEFDRWALARLEDLDGTVRKAYAGYQFHLAFNSLHQFCSVEMSSLYLDVIKDRLYVYAEDSFRRRSAQSALFVILRALCKMISPIMSFTAEEIWRHLPNHRGKEESPFMSVWDEFPAGLLDEAAESRWEMLLKMRREVTKALELARKEGLVGHPLDSKVILRVSDRYLNLLEDMKPVLRELFIVSQVDLERGASREPGLVSEDLPGFNVSVSRADGAKCSRCWIYSPETGASKEHPDVCPRCADILKSRREQP